MKNSFKLSLLLIVGVFVLSGCATTRAKRDAAAEPVSQVSELQSELEAKDQEIMELRNQLDSYQRSTGSSNFSSYGSGSSSSSSSIIRVAGVSVSDLQRALLRAGLDPGPVDGRLGKKTKSAVR